MGSLAVLPEDPRFAEQAPTDQHQIAFLRSTVWLRHDDGAPFVADPTLAVFRNRGSSYRRRAVGRGGDCRDWVEVDEAALRPLLRMFDPAAEEASEWSFPFSHASCDAAAYRLMRLATMHARAGGGQDPLLVEELVLRAVSRTLRLAYQQRLARPPLRLVGERAHELAERVRSLLADRYDEPLTISQLAVEVACSPFHLCRLFKLATGLTLHRYRTELRLRAALERVADPEIDLTEVALDLGFSAHSHFTNAFRVAFGEPPSAFRRHASRRRIAAAGGALAPAARSL